MGYVTKASKGRFKLNYIEAQRLLERKLKDQCLATIFNSVDKRYGIDKGLAQFYHTMQQAGFTVNLYQMEGESQKQVDVAIASTAVWQASRGNNIVLSSGDIDFLPAVRLITQEAQRGLILFTYNFGINGELIKTASEHWLFEDFPELVKV